MKINRLLFTIIVFILLIGCNNLTFANEYTNMEDEKYNPTDNSNIKESGYYSYMETSGGIYVVEYSGIEEVLNIPETVDGKKVIGLYSECFATAYNLKKVIIPKTVNAIYTDTFLNCSTLETIEVSSSNTTYSSYNGTLYSKDYVYFVCCPEGRKGDVVLRNGTVYICDFSFFNASKVTSIHIPASVIDVGEKALYDTSSLSSITVDNSNKYFVYSGGILYDKNKTEVIKCVDSRISCVNIASTVKKIRECAFFNCKKLMGPINFPNGLVSIGERAFFNCSSLTGDINLPSTLTTIGSAAFYNCKNITGLSISSNLEEIPDDCFCLCESVKNIVIPNGVKKIGERAFFECRGAESLIISNTVTQIGNWAFSYNESLKGDLIIPDSVVTIGDAAFDTCISLNGYIILGSKVSEIGDSVFYYCSNAKAIIFRGPVPAPSQYSFTEPSIPYYHLDGKVGFEDVLVDKAVYSYVEKPSVTFMINGSEYKKVNQTKYGLSVAEFSSPNIQNYNFEGWYYDEAYTKPYNFSDVIMNNTIIYAKTSTKNVIKFREKNILLAIGNNLKLNVEYSLEEGATFQDIDWTSSNEEILTVDNEGNITGVSKGEATITARYKNTSAELLVTVFKDENEISFSDNIERIVIGTQKKLNINYHLLNNATFEDIVWTSSDENVATVENGFVNAISEGRTKITASFDDAEANIEVLIVRGNSLEITTESFTIKEERYKNLDVNYYFNDDATESAIEWISSNSNIATVENGLVKAISTGNVTITARYKDVEDSINITVVRKDVISFNTQSLNIVNTVNTYTLDYNFYSYDYSVNDLEWLSSNTDVATVENGVLTILSNGQTTITARFGNTTAKILIEVVDSNWIEFKKDSINIDYRKDTSINLDADLDYYFNDGGNINNITFESSDSNIVKVLNNRLIPVGVGSATITAKYLDACDNIDINVVSIEKLSFKNGRCILKNGKSQILEYSFDSYNGDSENITFTSSNINIVRIENGYIYAVGNGEATITAKYGDMISQMVVVVTNEDYLLGDLDKNGIVNANDAALILDLYKYGNVTDEEKIIGDLDGNGIINANDAALILDIYKYGK